MYIIYNKKKIIDSKVDSDIPTLAYAHAHIQKLIYEGIQTLHIIYDYIFFYIKHEPFVDNKMLFDYLKKHFYH